MRVLLVEHESEEAQRMAQGLSEAGYNAELVADVNTGHDFAIFMTSVAALRASRSGQDDGQSLRYHGLERASLFDACRERDEGAAGERVAFDIFGRGPVHRSSGSSRADFLRWWRSMRCSTRSRNFTPAVRNGPLFSITHSARCAMPTGSSRLAHSMSAMMISLGRPLDQLDLVALGRVDERDHRATPGLGWTIAELKALRLDLARKLREILHLKGEVHQIRLHHHRRSTGRHLANLNLLFAVRRRKKHDLRPARHPSRIVLARRPDLEAGTSRRLGLLPDPACPCCGASWKKIAAAVARGDRQNRMLRLPSNNSWKKTNTGE